MFPDVHMDKAVNPERAWLHRVHGTPKDFAAV